MSPVAPIARWIAVSIAVAAVWDPPMPLPRRERPSVRVMASRPSDAVDGLTRSLRDVGFRVDGEEDEVATVVVGERVPSSDPAVVRRVRPAAPGASEDARYGSPLWALDTTPQPPNVALVSATASNVRLPGQAIEIRVSLEASGVAGKTTRLEIEDAGIAVASVDHGWKDTKERWGASLQYLPPGAAGGRLRVRAVALPGESTVEDNTADVGFPPVRAPLRTLVVEAGVTWPGLFVRRALEGEPAFAMSAVQRSSKNIATRAGSPPAALTRATLAPFEVVLVGGPDNPAAADLEALRWFVDERGGVAVFVPDQRPSGRYVDAIGGAAAFQLKVADEPLRLRGAAADAPLASEVLVAQHLPAAARILASTPAGEPVIFSARRGPGAVIFSGALDAWRYRARDQDAFARFWRRVISDEASAVPPALEVSVQPRILRPGGAGRITARIRATELPIGERVEIASISARAVSPGSRLDTPVRLWPTAEPGLYEGEWRAPAAGEYNVSVTSGTLRGDASVIVADSVAEGSQADPEGLALAARASGGQVFTVDRASALVDALRAAYPDRRVTRPTHPMRSAWWVVPFSLLLTTEWLLRRTAGKA